MGVVVDARFKSSMKDESDPLIMERPTAVRARASSSWMKPAALIVGGTLLAVGAATYVSTPYSTGLMLGQPKTGPVQGPPDGPKGPDEGFDIGCADDDARCLYEELCGVNMRVNKGGCMFDAQKRQDILENTLREIKECRDGENHNGDLVIQTLKVLFEVHAVNFPGDPYPIHIDATFTPIKEGLIINNPQRRLPKEQRKLFENNGWEIIDSAQPAHNEPPPLCYSSTWLSMNVLVLDPKTVCVEKSEVYQAEQLDKLGMEVIPVELRDAYAFGGGLHCCTADVYREGELKDYFPKQ